MCFGGGGSTVAAAPAVQPVNQAVASADELAPTIELASEDSLELAKKKKGKKGTSILQTDLAISGSSGLNTPS